ncbi:hypothetical protein, partial [Puniceibacterium confluentis]|uniref:hypothetical protein n=1 Tax=Puniceibacterium confluentis TaxID=1958944 RepID=UPI001C956FC4
MQHIPNSEKAQNKGISHASQAKSKNKFVMSHLTKRANPTVTALERSVGNMDRLGCLNRFYRALTSHFLMGFSNASNEKKTDPFKQVIKRLRFVLQVM